MTRQKNGTIRMSENELRSLLLVAWEGKERYKDMELNALAKKYEKAIRRMRIAMDMKCVGDIDVEL